MRKRSGTTQKRDGLIDTIKEEEEKEHDHEQHRLRLMMVHSILNTVVMSYNFVMDDTANLYWIRSFAVYCEIDGIIRIKFIPVCLKWSTNWVFGKPCLIVLFIIQSQKLQKVIIELLPYSSTWYYPINSGKESSLYTNIISKNSS